MVEDPWKVLGLPKQSTKEEVKRAYRQLALKFHPDKDPSKEAAAQFQRVQKAADAVLNKMRTKKGRTSCTSLTMDSLSPDHTCDAVERDVPIEVHTSEAAAAAARARQNWQGSGPRVPESAFWQQVSRRRATPLIFSAACIVGGCALFAGAVYVNQHMYNYNTAQAADERIRNPTPRQLQIMELLTEKRQKAAMNEATSRR